MRKAQWSAGDHKPHDWRVAAWVWVWPALTFLPVFTVLLSNKGNKRHNQLEHYETKRTQRMKTPQINAGAQLDDSPSSLWTADNTCLYLQLQLSDADSVITLSCVHMIIVLWFVAGQGRSSVWLVPVIKVLSVPLTKKRRSQRGHKSMQSINKTSQRITLNGETHEDDEQDKQRKWWRKNTKLLPCLFLRLCIFNSSPRLLHWAKGRMRKMWEQSANQRWQATKTGSGN